MKLIETAPKDGTKFLAYGPLGWTITWYQDDIFVDLYTVLNGSGRVEFEYWTFLPPEPNK